MGLRKSRLASEGGRQVAKVCVGDETRMAGAGCCRTMLRRLDSTL